MLLGYQAVDARCRREVYWPGVSSQSSLTAVGVGIDKAPDPEQRVPTAGIGQFENPRTGVGSQIHARIAAEVDAVSTVVTDIVAGEIRLRNFVYQNSIRQIAADRITDNFRGRMSVDEYSPATVVLNRIGTGDRVATESEPNSRRCTLTDRNTTPRVVLDNVVDDSSVGTVSHGNSTTTHIVDGIVIYGCASTLSHPDAIAPTGNRGKILYGNPSPKYANRLTIGIWSADRRRSLAVQGDVYMLLRYHNIFVAGAADQNGRPWPDILCQRGRDGPPGTTIDVNRLSLADGRKYPQRRCQNSHSPK